MVYYFRKLVNLFYKNYSNKPLIILFAINIILLIAWSIIKPTKFIKQK